MTVAAGTRVSWRTVRAARWREWMAAMHRVWRRVPGVVAVAEFIDVSWRHGLPERLGTRLAPRRLAVFEAEAGRSAGGQVRAISEELHRAHPEIAQTWVYRSRPDIVPAYAEPVARHSARHHRRANRAAYWVDDGLASLWITKPPRTVAMLAGWGAPVHRVGLDDPSVLVRTGAVRNLARRYGRYDLALASSRFAGDLLGPALGLNGVAVAVGIPRMDAALALRARGPAALADARRALDLPQDRRIVVYAPTVREPSARAVPPVLDLHRWADDLGNSTYLLVHAHPQQPLVVPDTLRFAVRDIGRDDIGPYLAVADLLVSDYSSVIGDAVLAGIPVVAFQPDLVEFARRTRGLYAGAGVPGPSTSTMDGLIDEVRAWLEDPATWGGQHTAASAAFASDRCGPADGRSSERAVAALIAGGQ